MKPNAIRLVVVAALITVASSLGSCSPLASKGTMPPPALNGQVDASAAPDFIAVPGGNGGVTGYVPKAYLFPQPTTAIGRPEEPDIPVFGEDLRTLIGHMVPGKGFVPLDVDPLTVPTIQVRAGPSLAAPPGESTNLTLYVRNATTQQAWFAVHAVGAQGYNNGGGVGCFNLVVGEQLVILTEHRRTPEPERCGSSIAARKPTSGQPSGSTSVPTDRSARARGFRRGGWARRRSAEPDRTKMLAEAC